MASDQFQYLEVWDRLQAAGGVCKGRFLPASTDRRRSVNGDDAYQVRLPKTNRCVPFIEQGAAIREILSVDGATWREWPVAESPHSGSGNDLLVVVDCISPLLTLVNYPIETSDGDGFVYQETAAVQITIATILATWVRARTPSWIVNGTLDPTGLLEVPFSRDTALSGLRRIEEITDKEASLTPIGTTQYGIHLTTIGGSAAPLYLRAGKQLQQFRKKGVPGMVNRFDPIRGKDGDDPGTSPIAFAYWEVDGAPSGSKVKLKAIHGGDGPIGFDDQLNHANLPGGANSLYLEKEDGTFTQITDSEVATQELTVASITGISAGHWVRIVASSTGRHLTFLDHPSSIAAYGVVAGEYESAFDDTVQIAKNGLQENWATPSSVPDGWSGVGSRTTAANEWATAGQALKMTGSRSNGTQLAAPPARPWRIQNRRSFFSATAIIRVLAAFSQPDSQLILRLKAGSTVLGQIGYGTARYNDMVQLKMAGVDLTAYIGQTPSLTAELVLGAPTSGSENVQLIVDSICFGPSLTARAPCEGSNGARVWQEVNRRLEETAPLAVAYEMGAADLDALGVSGQVPVVLGQTVHTYPDEPNLPTVVIARLLQISDRSEDKSDARYVIGTLPPRASRKRAAPADLVIPFIEPLDVQWAKEDTRNAALFLAIKTPLEDDATTVTINLDVRDTRGATPTITATAIGGASVISGSGTGPWVIGKPAAGADAGRAIFTAKYPGRNDATDAVDIPAQVGIPLTLQALLQSTTASQMVVRVFGADGVGGATVTLTYSAPGLTVSPASGQTFTSVASPTATPGVGEYVDLTITRPAENTGTRRVQCRATASGHDAGAVSIEVPDQSVAGILGKLEVVSTSGTQTVVRMSTAIVGGPATTAISLQYENNGLTVSPASGSQQVSSMTNIYDTPVGGQYADFTITRGAAGTGTKLVTFYGIKSGYWNDQVSVDVPDQGQALLVAKATRQSSTVGSITVRVSTADGVGGATATITYDAGGLTVSPASGQTQTTMADIASTPGASEYDDFEITKPTFGNPPSRVAFLATVGSMKFPFAVDVEAQERDTIALSVKLKLQTINATTVVVRVEPVDPFPPGGASVTLSYTSTTSASPSSPQTVTPDTVFNDTNYVDFTVDRPTAGASAARFTVIAADTTNSRIPATDSIDVPPQEPPSLVVTGERVSTTQWKFTWTSTGTVEVKKNNEASWQTPATYFSSGTAFNRGDTDDEYTFKCSNGGQEISWSGKVLAKEGGALGVTAPHYNSGSSVDIKWTHANFPSGTVYNVSWKRFNSSGTFQNVAGESLGVSGSPLNVNPTASSTDRFEVTVSAVFNGRTLNAITFYRQLTT